MKRNWGSVFILLFLLAFLGNWVFAQETKGPRIVIREAERDFKDIKEGETLEHTFRVFNEGDQILEIREVKPG
ncbi:MAG: hypothetical protein V1689_14215 [Pseudomonadota bacterium]